MRKTLLSAALALLFATAATAQAPKPAAPPAAPSAASAATAAAPAGLTRGATVEGITEYTLANGLRVLLVPDPSKQTVTVNVTYFVGSRHEDYGETGMAHLLEHLVFKGTPTTPNVPQALTDHGARPNGTTWFDRTNYFETMPATDANLEWAIRFEADRMVNSFIAKKDLDSEMTVVRNELEMGENDPASVLNERLMSTAYLWHNYGKSTIGARADVENVPIDRLQGFYRKYYQPDNAMLVVAGKFDEKKALALIGDAFGKLPRPTRKLPGTYTAEPTQDGERLVTVRRVGGNQLVMSGYHVPAGTHEDFPAIDVLAEVLGDTPSGRLHTQLVKTKKAAKVAAGSYQLREPGMLLFSVELKKGDKLEPARDALLATVETAAAKPFTAEEVERAKTALLKQIELTLNSSERVGLQLSEWAAMGDWRMLFLHRDRLKKVTPEAVTRAAATYLKAENRTLAIYFPTEKPNRSEIPAVPDVAALVKDYKGEQGLAVGEVFEPSPQNIEARTVRQTLPNGMKVALLNKKTRGETVNVQLVLRTGNEKSLSDLKTVGTFTASMLMHGTKKLSRQELKDAFDRMKARVSVAGGPTAVTVTIEARRPELVPALSLVTQVLREPAFSPKELEELRAEVLTGIEAQKQEPNVLAQLELQRLVDPWPKSHPFYNASLDEQAAAVKAVKVADLKAFHTRFYGADSGQLAIVGDFDTDAVMKLVTSTLGSWKSQEKFARIPRTHRPFAPKAVAVETPDKAGAAYFSSATFALRDDDADYPALVMADFILGGGFLNSRIANRLRQKDGVSYGAGSFFHASPLDKDASINTYAIYAPENVDKVETGMTDELKKALASGFGDDELAKAKLGLLQLREQSRARDNELVRTLANYLFLDRKLTFDQELEKKLSALTAKQLGETFAKYVAPSKMGVVKAGDFAGAAKKAATPPAKTPPAKSN